MKKCFLFVLLFLLLLSVPAVALANSPAPPTSFGVYIENRPEQAVYADLLLPMDSLNEKYADFNEENGEAYGLSRECQLVSYAEDGFVSYTFHFAGAVSEMDLRPREESEPGDVAYFCRFSQRGEELDHYGYIYKHFKQARIALADEQGNILQVSESFNFARNSLLAKRSGLISYNAATNIAEEGTTPRYMVAFLELTLLIILCSSGVETLLALLFRFRGKELLVVFLTNVITQIVLHTIFLVPFLLYRLALLLTEVLVLICEFAVYKLFFFKNRSAGFLLGFTFVSNFTSFLLGALLLLLFL